MKLQQLDIYRQVITRCYNSLDHEQDFQRLVNEKVKNANSLDEKKEAVLYLIQSFALLSNSNYQTDVPIMQKRQDGKTIIWARLENTWWVE